MNGDPQNARGHDQNATDKIRVDKWLWQARFVKSRSLAAGLVKAGHVRINGDRAGKPAATVSPGDVLTFPLGDVVRVVRLVALGIRRGPAPEAQALYEDLTPARDPGADKGGEKGPTFTRDEGNARPTKRDRRKLDLDRRRALE